MARVLITGSADGLGLMAGAILTRQGHTVTLRARSGQLVPVVRDVATTLWTWGFGRPCGPQ